MRWSTPQLAVLKMLAWVVREHEHISGDRLWQRCAALCSAVFSQVLGEDNVSLGDICAETLEMQGAPLTAQRLSWRPVPTGKNA